jgi:hypothetical protein
MEWFRPRLRRAVRRFGIRSTVLPPAAITMLTDDDDQIRRCATSAASRRRPPVEARRFADRFGGWC